MKRDMLFLSLVAALIAGCGVGEESTTQTRPPDEPYSDLDAYGSWIMTPEYGRVWQPAVSSDWRPYSNGEWVWTDNGWLWMSDEPYAWVVYHYGYWMPWGSGGWAWIPGDEWSPARVRWIAGDGYVGWAPLPPPRMQLPEAYASNGLNFWVIVAAQEFTHRDVGRYRMRNLPDAYGRVPEPERQRPPDVRVIERATNQSIRPATVQRESVRRGERTLVRVRVGEPVREVPAPVPQPAAAPAPIPTATPQPAPPARKDERTVTPPVRGNTETTRKPPTKNPEAVGATRTARPATTRRPSTTKRDTAVTRTPQRKSNVRQPERKSVNPKPSEGKSRNEEK